MYLKHINFRTIEAVPAAPPRGHPDYTTSNGITPSGSSRTGTATPSPVVRGEVLDFGNDAFLDWALDVWMPNQFWMQRSRPESVTWYLHDNGISTGCS